MLAADPRTKLAGIPRQVPIVVDFWIGNVVLLKLCFKLMQGGLPFESYIRKERRVSMMGPFSSWGAVHAARVAGSANNIASTVAVAIQCDQTPFHIRNSI